MPTSVPGNSRRRTRDAIGGFTLIEMLVVLMIMGLMIGLVSVTLRPNKRATLKIEADRLAQLLTLAQSEARMTGKPLAWTGQSSSYRFWRYSRDTGWSPVGDGGSLRQRVLPHGIVISGLTVESMPRRDGDYRLEFFPDGESDAFTIDLALGDLHYLVAADPVGNIAALRDRTNGQAL